MKDELQRTLHGIIESGSKSNAAVNEIIHDYTKFHAVLVIVGGGFFLLFAWLSLLFWTAFGRSPKIGHARWSFASKTYFSFGLLSSSVALIIMLIAIVNLTTTLHPLHGFSFVVDSLELTDGATYKDELKNAVNDWVQSGHSALPPILQERIDSRIEFHTTKAIGSGLLLILSAGLSLYLWRALVRRANSNDSTWGLKEKAYFTLGHATVALSLLMVVIVAANIQGALAPMTIFIVNLFSS
ncbi:hypothetical protein GXP70_26950 [Paenibacillus lycopersici]|uniref:Uncharacterized protein n=1 Tax=Paenibacillus lycopersici TaxID=2704462 RepID=A0A6C0G6J7_9BACL|nr:hypothetical protein [Paenibacillus lycopersici]QHT63240.1 hypothetical protein GXP70_26950 [Paenibacillus lycopersici]